MGYMSSRAWTTAGVFKSTGALEERRAMILLNLLWSAANWVHFVWVCNCIELDLSAFPCGLRLGIVHDYVYMS